MLRFILAFSIIISIAALPTVVTAQSLTPENGLALVIFKYDKTVGIWERALPNGEYHVALRGDLYRSFPTGPKVYYGDQRIPEGIYDGRIDSEGNISFRFQTLPDMFETYRISGPSLDRNVIPVRGDMIDEIRSAAKSMLVSGFASIPIIILPGTLEPEIADMLRSANNVREGQSLADVEYSIRRWRPVEDYLVKTGRIPRLRFNGSEIIILEENERPGSLAAQ